MFAPVPGTSGVLPCTVTGTEEWLCLSDPCEERLQPVRTEKAAGAD